ncbi:hypothetical protein PR249_03385 [Metamycoplasma hyosynoviae]|uniref:Uncharacterized protein n=1 Tax=Metamycoplasma hyosynoviae TaxID=29559 RepID=A0AAP4ALA6_9BACT|nr:hypothetical protein [Metamycoplasma hyosynoviae]MDC8901302.1 hypothetical protein [Metamycoplasma hyosynoviae]MDC8913176.1 hypothetical protein [Metamycoplasma hyosynoviae]MDC8915329.1 hypothetical protein [Metamycoplasma hyosynoviae]MDD1375023.1 hypothetical protein [Metamycoplasma hyosynoviae]MDI3048179.1 hypothetical protein [Metamycoplasma hyosynoviae]
MLLLQMILPPDLKFIGSNDDNCTNAVMYINKEFVNFIKRINFIKSKWRYI